MVNPNTKSATLVNKTETSKLVPELDLLKVFLEENQFQIFQRMFRNSETLSIFLKKLFDLHRTLPKLHSTRLLQFTIRGPTIHDLTMHETAKRSYFKT